MPKMKKIQFLVDEKGRKTSVLMSYRAYRELMEDLDDLSVKTERSEETPEDFQKVLDELKDAGRV